MGVSQDRKPSARGLPSPRQYTSGPFTTGAGRVPPRGDRPRPERDNRPGFRDVPREPGGRGPALGPKTLHEGETPCARVNDPREKQLTLGEGNLPCTRVKHPARGSVAFHEGKAPCKKADVPAPGAAARDGFDAPRQAADPPAGGVGALVRLPGRAAPAEAPGRRREEGRWRLRHPGRRDVRTKARSGRAASAPVEPLPRRHGPKPRDLTPPPRPRRTTSWYAQTACGFPRTATRSRQFATRNGHATP